LSYQSKKIKPLKIIIKSVLLLYGLIITSELNPLFLQETHVKKHEHKIKNQSLIEINKKYDAAWEKWRGELFNLPIKMGMQVGEIGAGKGEFALLISNRVGKKGHVYANEIDKHKIKIIKELADNHDLDNITPITGNTDDPLFPAINLDLSVMVEVYHHLDYPSNFLKSLIKYLKPGSRLYIIDPDVNQKDGTLEGCYSDPATAKKLAKEAGFNFVDLKWQKVLNFKFYILTVEAPSS